MKNKADLLVAIGVLLCFAVGLNILRNFDAHAQSSCCKHRTYPQPPRDFLKVQQSMFTSMQILDLLVPNGK
jgi:hypothetical protein